MSDKKLERRSDVPSSSVPTTIPLSPSTALDLSWLGEEERKIFLMEYSRGMIDVSKKAQELHVDVASLRATLDGLAKTARDASEQGASVTVAHTETTSHSRTEILMGNTKHAASGRMTKSQTGTTDYTLVYILAGLVALVVILVIANSN